MVTIVPPILGFEKPLNENGGRKPSLGLVLVCSGCSNRQENTGEPEVSEQNVSSEGERREDSETDREADTDVGESSEGAREFDSSIIKKTFAGRINPVLFLSNFSFLYMLFYVIV